MAKRRTKRAAAREKKRINKEQGMGKPGGKSRYGKKMRKLEMARGYSRRPASPFYMSPSEVASARARQPIAEREAA